MSAGTNPKLAQFREDIVKSKRKISPPSREPIDIRPARQSDHAVLMRLIRAYYRYDKIRFEAASIGRGLRKLLREPSLGRVWIAWDGARAVGYILLSFNFDLEFSGVEGYVTDLFVDEPHRAHGLGRRLMEVVFEFCRAEGLATVELQVIHHNRRALGFYQRLGFELLPRYVMQREV